MRKRRANTCSECLLTHVAASGNAWPRQTRPSAVGAGPYRVTPSTPRNRSCSWAAFSRCTINVEGMRTRAGHRCCCHCSCRCLASETWPVPRARSASTLLPSTQSAADVIWVALLLSRGAAASQRWIGSLISPHWRTEAGRSTMDVIASAARAAATAVCASFFCSECHLHDIHDTTAACVAFTALFGVLTLHKSEAAHVAVSCPRASRQGGLRGTHAPSHPRSYASAASLCPPACHSTLLCRLSPCVSTSAARFRKPKMSASATATSSTGKLKLYTSPGSCSMSPYFALEGSGALRGFRGYRVERTASA